MWYLMLSHTDLPPVSAEVAKEALTNHFAFLKRQHPAGKILFSRSTPDRSRGFYVIKAGSHNEAVTVAAEDPIHTYNVRSAEVIDWEVHQIMGAGFKD
jgi:uncharacterized protein YciI